MKKSILTKLNLISFLLIGLFSLLVTNCFSQTQNYIDVIILKNGTVLRGIIVEEIPKVSIKIQTKDQNIFVCKFSDIEKVTKELNSNLTINNQPKRDRIKLKHFEGVYLGLSIGPAFPVGQFQTSNLKPAIGLLINYFDFTYKSNSTVGITVKVTRMSFNNEAKNLLEIPNTKGTSYILGPVLSFPVSAQSSFDFRLLGGLSRFIIPGSEIDSNGRINYNSEKKYSLFSYSSELVFSTMLSKKLFLNIGSSYFLTGYREIKETSSYNYNFPGIKTVNFLLGVSIKLD